MVVWWHVIGLWGADANAAYKDSYVGSRRRMWKGNLYQQSAVIRILQESPDPSRVISTRMEIVDENSTIFTCCSLSLQRWARANGTSGRSRTARYPPKHCTSRANSCTKPRKVACTTTTDALVAVAAAGVCAWACVREIIIGLQLSLHSCIDISACCCHCSNTPTAKSHPL